MTMFDAMMLTLLAWVVEGHRQVTEQVIDDIKDRCRQLERELIVLAPLMPFAPRLNHSISPWDMWGVGDPEWWRFSNNRADEKLAEHATARYRDSAKLMARAGGRVTKEPNHLSIEGGLVTVTFYDMGVCQKVETGETTVVKQVLPTEEEQAAIDELKAQLDQLREQATREVEVPVTKTVCPEVFG